MAARRGVKTKRDPRNGMSGRGTTKSGAADSMVRSVWVSGDDAELGQVRVSKGCLLTQFLSVFFGSVSVVITT